MTIPSPKIVLPEAPPPIPPPPIAGEDTVRGVASPKKKSKKNPLLLGDAPTAAPALGSSPSGVFGGSPGGLAIP